MAPPINAYTAPYSKILPLLPHKPQASSLLLLFVPHTRHTHNTRAPCHRCAYSSAQHSRIELGVLLPQSLQLLFVSGHLPFQSLVVSRHRVTCSKQETHAQWVGCSTQEIHAQWVASSGRQGCKVSPFKRLLSADTGLPAARKQHTRNGLAAARKKRTRNGLAAARKKRMRNGYLRLVGRAAKSVYLK